MILQRLMSKKSLNRPSKLHAKIELLKNPFFSRNIVKNRQNKIFEKKHDYAKVNAEIKILFVNPNHS